MKECLETFFFKLLTDFFSDSSKKHQKIAKVLFFSRRATSLCDTFFPGKLRSLVIFLRNLVQFFWNFWQQKQNLAENYQHSCQNSTPRFHRDFWGNTCSSEKKSNEYSDFQRNFSFFVVFWDDYQKGVPLPKWEYWGKTIFFWKKNVFDFFSALERRIVILWRWISNRLSKMRLVCLEEFFSRRSFLFWKIF